MSNTDNLLNEWPLEMEQESMDFTLFQLYFDFLVANIVRSKESFTVVFLSVYEINHFSKQYGFAQTKDALQQMDRFLVKQTRNSDLIFQSPLNNDWLFLLPRSSQEEAKYFLKRIFDNIPNINIDNGEE